MTYKLVLKKNSKDIRTSSKHSVTELNLSYTITPLKHRTIQQNSIDITHPSRLREALREVEDTTGHGTSRGRTPSPFRVKGRVDTKYIGFYFYAPLFLFTPDGIGLP